MGTPIYRRFRNQTRLIDQTAPLPVLDVGALVTTEAVTDQTVRFISVTADEWKTTIVEATHPVTYKWCEAYFGQEVKPEKAILIFFKKEDPDKDATIKVALDDAVGKRAQFYFVSYSGNALADIADQEALAQWVQAYEAKVQGMILTNDPLNYDLTNNTSIRAKCKAAGLSRTSVLFHPTGTVNGIDLTKQRPDGAIVGRMMPTIPTSQGVFEQWDWKTLAFVSDSGLTSAQQDALHENGGNFIENITNSDFTGMFKGRTCTNREIRMQWGADWFDVNVMASLMNYATRAGLMAYDDDTYAGIETIYREWLDRATNRRLINSYTLTMPDPYKVPASVRTTGKLSITDLYLGEMNNAIDEIDNTGTWQVGGV